MLVTGMHLQVAYCRSYLPMEICYTYYPFIAIADMHDLIVSIYSTTVSLVCFDTVSPDPLQIITGWVLLYFTSYCSFSFYSDSLSVVTPIFCYAFIHLDHALPYLNECHVSNEYSGDTVQLCHVSNEYIGDTVCSVSIWCIGILRFFFFFLSSIAINHNSLFDHVWHTLRVWDDGECYYSVLFMNSSLQWLRYPSYSC